MSNSATFFLIIGPSGVGKTSMVNYLKQKHSNFYFPRSATTRPKRESDAQYDNYDFFSEAYFKSAIEKNMFLEYALVHNSFAYGTLAKEIEEALDRGQTVVKEMDIAGYEQVLQKPISKRVKSIFIHPEFMEDLLKYMKIRGDTMSDKQKKARLASAVVESEKADLCDYQLINYFDDFEGLIDEVEEIIKL